MNAQAKRRRDKKGRNPNEHYTMMARHMMMCPAWQALTTTAQALYPWLRLEWHGAAYNNNGKIRLSVRQSAERLGIGVNTAARGFHDLQAKGFIVVTERACLGIRGMARSAAYELTELAMPTSDQPAGRKLYRDWKSGHDFPVEKHGANNPAGHNGKI
jgi:DNA-binding transcriptional MocR family regulator